MARYIPFVNTQEDCQLLRQHYLDSTVVRVSLEKIESIAGQLPRQLPLWVDGAVDGYEHHLRKEEEAIPGYLKSIPEFEVLGHAGAVEKPDGKRVKKFVNALLDKCCQFKPLWLTIPQLPVVDTTVRNKMNSALATAAREWKSQSQFDGKLILPLIFTNKNQVCMKTKWRPRMDSALKWYAKAGADGVWAVDSSLSDQKGTGNYRNRFASLVELHEYLRDRLSGGTTIVAGPYWGINLVLWARGLCDHPAICLGTGYQYHISGGFRKRGRTKVAIPPLRRLAVAGPELKIWLDDVLALLDPKGKAYTDFSMLRDNYDSLLAPFASKGQIAKFHRAWIHEIDQIPFAGRSLALYQDLSSAYVLGRQLPTLPPSGSFARRPEKVAEYYMLNCL